MMKMSEFARARRAVFVACSVACCAASFQAQADTTDLASGYASLSNVSFRLIDLAPQSGRTPSVTFGQTWPFSGGYVEPLQGWAYASGQVLQDHETGFSTTPYWQEAYFNGPLPQDAVNVAATDGTGTVSVHAAGMSASMRVGADALDKAVAWEGTDRKIYQVTSAATSGETPHTPTPDWGASTYPQITISTDSPSFQPTQFTLSAHTKLVLEGDAAAELSLQPGLALPWDDPNFIYSPSVYAGVSLSLARGTALHSLAGTYASYEDFIDTVKAAYTWDTDWLNAQTSDDPSILKPDARHLSVSLVNDSDEDITGIFLITASAGAAFYAPLDAVPEPSTYLLMGLGLVGMGWLRRRAA